jgi:hypothetical protein
VSEQNRRRCERGPVPVGAAETGSTEAPDSSPSLLSIPGWSRFQHYNGRRPPWIKVAREHLDNPSFGRLPLSAKGVLLQLWLLASEEARDEASDEGRLPDLDSIAWRLRVAPADIASELAALTRSGFIRERSASSVLADRAHPACLEERRGDESRGDGEHAVATDACHDVVNAHVVDELASRYLQVFNASHGTTHSTTQGLRTAVRVCLATKAYPYDALLAAAIVSSIDSWYEAKNPIFPLRFSSDPERKSHLDDLLALIAPGVKFPERIVELVKQFEVVDYFKEKTRKRTIHGRGRAPSIKPEGEGNF